MNCFLRETAGNRVPQVLAQQQAPAEEAQ
jgi:hypothetical protein